MEEPLIPNQQQSFSSQFFTDQFISNMMELEGQCKIKEVIYLRINYPKAIFLIFFLSISIVGLFLLKYFFKLRAKVFYSTIEYNDIKHITHIYVKGQEGEEQISNVTKTNYNSIPRVIFQFKKLRYEIHANKRFPIGFSYILKIGTLRRQSYLQQGLSNNDALKMEEFYGKNEHNVQVPTYFQFLFDTMTTPFFLLQYLISAIFILQSMASFGIVLVVFSFITTSINYMLLKRSYNKIKETAEKLFKVRVFRNGTYQQIDNVDIVPGDLYEPGDEIPCDSMVVKGELFVDECNLTGENVPIAKFKIIDDAKHNDKSHWLFEGSRIETMKEHTLALAVNVGYASQRGRIIRKILNKTSKQPQFLTKLIYFQVQILIISFLIILGSLPSYLQYEIDKIFLLFRFLNFITYSVNASFPVYFNLAYSFCLIRLYKENIVGTQAEKTVQSSRMKTICFDKTGTLTQSKMSISKVYQSSEKEIKQITENVGEYQIISALFACCNSVQVINGEVKGDEIDLRMFELVRGNLSAAKTADVVREASAFDTNTEVVKINQYESQFQSMSVLVRSPQTNKYFVFVKGSPEMIHHYSVRKINGFDALVKRLSFSGFRSIGFGFKEVRAQEVEGYLLKGREDFLVGTSILGVVTFVNQLKADAKSTVATLADCDINTKIITGDNIFLGVQTALMVGMIPPQARITVVEGKRYDRTNNAAEVLNLFRNESGEVEENAEKITDFHFEEEANHFYAVDNDFIKANPQGFLHDKVKVFARISPENKALIVRQHKERIAQERQGLSFWQGLRKDCSFKVGMVGDGANDLIAIKEAHVGIGISTSDAVFSASFAVRELSQILQIINESKNSERQIVQMTKYYALTQFISIVVTLICCTDLTYLTSQELSYKGFASTLTITLLLAMTKPVQQITKYLNNSNFMDLEHHLVYWVTTIIYTTGLIVAYVYYYNSPDFQPNTHRVVTFATGFYNQTKTSTVNFIASNIAYILLPFSIYRSQPWKLPIWSNRPVMVLIILNIVALILISIFPSRFSFLGVQNIGREQAMVIWLIMLATSAMSILANKLIQKIFFQKMKKKQKGKIHLLQEIIMKSQF